MKIFIINLFRVRRDWQKRQIMVDYCHHDDTANFRQTREQNTSAMRHASSLNEFAHSTKYVAEKIERPGGFLYVAFRFEIASRIDTP
jgi:hypothetical protein